MHGQFVHFFLNKVELHAYLVWFNRDDTCSHRNKTRAPVLRTKGGSVLKPETLELKRSDSFNCRNRFANPKN